MNPDLLIEGWKAAVRGAAPGELAAPGYDDDRSLRARARRRAQAGIGEARGPRRARDESSPWEAACKPECLLAYWGPAAIEPARGSRRTLDRPMETKRGTGVPSRS